MQDWLRRIQATFEEDKIFENWENIDNHSLYLEGVNGLDNTITDNIVTRCTQSHTWFETKLARAHLKPDSTPIFENIPALHLSPHSTFKKRLHEEEGNLEIWNESSSM